VDLEVFLIILLKDDKRIFQLKNIEQDLFASMAQKLNIATWWRHFSDQKWWKILFLYFGH